jgi:hypothetical protein
MASGISSKVMLMRNYSSLSSRDGEGIETRIVVMVMILGS